MRLRLFVRVLWSRGPAGAMMRPVPGEELRRGSGGQLKKCPSTPMMPPHGTGPCQPHPAARACEYDRPYLGTWSTARTHKDQTVSLASANVSTRRSTAMSLRRQRTMRLSLRTGYARPGWRSLGPGSRPCVLLSLTAASACGTDSRAVQSSPTRHPVRLTTGMRTRTVLALVMTSSKRDPPDNPHMRCLATGSQRESIASRTRRTSIRQMTAPFSHTANLTQPCAKMSWCSLPRGKGGRRLRPALSRPTHARLREIIAAGLS
mmetsp:Transcript_103909/g.222141  ORF Transcript_103909/g.222141 Transcript_103909/m.222141 type:complete len:262 (-) Transcript_103909:639-1424(-)